MGCDARAEARALGLRVVRARLPSPVLEGLFAWRSGRPLILLADDLPAQRSDAVLSAFLRDYLKRLGRAV